MISSECFAPVIAQGARVLILGSMPGQRSLSEQQYYAHPRNVFWPIMATLFGFSAEIAYPDRLQALQQQGVALWDVLACCERPGSLDSAIVEGSIQVNDFAALFLQYPTIEALFFNGAKAEQSYQKYVLPGLVGSVQPKLLQRLPSTSPAHASLKFSQKLQQWRQLRRLIAS